MNEEIKYKVKYPEWQTPLQQLILEFDRPTFLEKLQKVETLIFERQQQLRRRNDGHIETRALNDAQVVLRIFKQLK